MKKFLTLCAMAVLLAAGAVAASAQEAVVVAKSYNFGDHRSSTLATKAWEALNAKDLDGVLAYTNKCIEMYGENARTMQAGLAEYPAGDDQKIFSFWALNDIATCLYIQGEAYRQAGKLEEAKKAYEKIVKEFSFGQTFDPANKSFWKPAQAAKEKLDMMAKGLDIDFGDMKSNTLVQRAWASLAAKNLEAVKMYVNKVTDLYGQEARTMQGSMKEYAWESKEKIFSFWALNDVGTALFVLGEAYRQAGNKAEAVAAYQTLVNDYFYAQCWDPQGWFWKPAEAAQQKIVELEMAPAAPVAK